MTFATVSLAAGAALISVTGATGFGAAIGKSNFFSVFPDPVVDAVTSPVNPAKGLGAAAGGATAPPAAKLKLANGLPLGCAVKLTALTSSVAFFLYATN